jgi:hypothetical protein
MKDRRFVMVESPGTLLRALRVSSELRVCGDAHSDGCVPKRQSIHNRFGINLAYFWVIEGRRSVSLIARL